MKKKILSANLLTNWFMLKKLTISTNCLNFNHYYYFIIQILKLHLLILKIDKKMYSSVE